MSLLRDRQRDEALIPIIAIVWPEAALSTGATTVRQLQRPLDAWEVCRALSTIVTVD